MDYDFTICPRCSAEVSAARGSGSECYLCLQTPARSVSRTDLLKEQERIDAQIAETAELMRARESAAEEIVEAMRHAKEERARVAADLDFATRAFVSSRTDEISRLAAERSAARERVRRYRDYIELYSRFDAMMRDIARLEDEKAEVLTALGALESAVTDAEERIRFLERSMSEILREFKVVQFGTPRVTIDRETLLPVINGRTFDSISSHGVNVLVNIAHALAHQRTGLKFGLRLPNILFIDGLSGNIGTEGLDRERVEAVYAYLRGVNDRAGDRFQIIVADNDVPASMRGFVRLQLTDDDRLIPVAPVTGDDDEEDLEETDGAAFA